MSAPLSFIDSGPTEPRFYIEWESHLRTAHPIAGVKSINRIGDRPPAG